MLDFTYLEEFYVFVATVLLGEKIKKRHWKRYTLEPYKAKAKGYLARNIKTPGLCLLIVGFVAIFYGHCTAKALMEASTPPPKRNIWQRWHWQQVREEQRTAVNIQQFTFYITSYPSLYKARKI